MPSDPGKRFMHTVHFKNFTEIHINAPRAKRADNIHADAYTIQEEICDAKRREAEPILDIFRLIPYNLNKYALRRTS